MAYYVTCNLPFVQGPAHVCVSSKRSARYQFQICPPKRGSYKGVVVFVTASFRWTDLKRGSYKDNHAFVTAFYRDVDSDGDEIPPLEPDDPTDFQYSLWFTVEIDVQAPDAQAVVELTAPCLVRTVS